MSKRVSVKYTTKTNKITGQTFAGWYVTDYNEPIGKAYNTKKEAIKATGLYTRSVVECLKV